MLMHTVLIRANPVAMYSCKNMSARSTWREFGSNFGC